jgi:hypothetical protein
MRHRAFIRTLFYIFSHQYDTAIANSVIFATLIPARIQGDWFMQRLICPPLFFFFILLSVLFIQALRADAGDMTLDPAVKIAIDNSCRTSSIAFPRPT